ncbi:SLAM family member 8-like isoform X3 [Lagopus leucura]|nr:SLAM family member 8-like isoform X3 [Lagopus leucura]
MEGDLARRAARLLLALLGFAPELLFGQVRAQPQQVSGVLGGSVLLSPVLPPGSRVKEIEWSFSSGAGATIQVAEFGPGGFERPDPQDRFKQRLEMPNATALRIGALELGDSGLYGARIKLHPALVEDQSFNLSVYESVPRPRTHSQLLASTLEWCNLTLQCQGTGKGAVNVTWRRDNGRQELGTDRSQLSPDGTTLRLALQPGTANATYTCTVSNPADQKVVPFDLQSICRSGALFCVLQEDRCPSPSRGTSSSPSSCWLSALAEPSGAGGSTARSQQIQLPPPQHRQRRAPQNLNTPRSYTAAPRKVTTRAYVHLKTTQSRPRQRKHRAAPCMNRSTRSQRTQPRR